MKILLRRIALVVVTLTIGYVGYIVTIAGELRTLEPHFAGRCQLVPGVVGPEDIVILADGSGAYVSSNDRRAHLAGEPASGGIYYFDLSRPDAAPIDVTPPGSPMLHPHGIGLHEPSGTLFVVNHPRGDLHGDIPGEGPAHTIEVYDIAGAALTHRRTIVDEELLIAPNDVAPVGRDAFYVTNDHGSGSKLARKLEDYLRVGRGHVLYFDGATFSRLPGDYRYANGIIASRDGGTVYLASPADRTMYVFSREAGSPALTLVSEVFVDTGIDNIDLDAAGDVWIGAHPKLLSFVRHVADPDAPSPSQVLHLSRGDDGSFEIEEVFLSDGTDMSSSSSAARHGDRLLIGSVLAPGFLDCRMDPSSPSGAGR